MGYRLGIDLGTAFTAAAFAGDGGAAPGMLELGHRRVAVPSVVFVGADGGLLFGEAAERRAVAAPDRVVREFKRRFGDEVPFLVGGRSFSSVELQTHVLRWILDFAELRLPPMREHAVVTHPANWGPYKLKCMRQMLADAGVNGAVLLPEPVAAAINFGASRELPVGARLLVYDLGGGTFDVAVVENDPAGFRLCGTALGLDHVGGADFDEAVLGYVLERLGPLRLDPDDPDVASGLIALQRESVEAKEALSTDVSTQLTALLPGAARTFQLGRRELEELIRPALEETVATSGRALRLAGMEPADLHAIVLVGGSSRIPLVTELLSREFGVPVVLDTYPKNAIALGAARYAATTEPGSAQATMSVVPMTSGFGPEPVRSEPEPVRSEPESVKSEPEPGRPEPTAAVKVPAAESEPGLVPDPDAAPEAGFATEPIKPKPAGAEGPPTSGSVISDRVSPATQAQKVRPRWLIPAILAAVLVVIAVVGVVALNRPKELSGSSAANGPDSGNSLASVPDKRIGVAVYDENSFTGAIREGMESYAKAKNIELQWDTASMDAATQASQLDQMVNAGVDAIVLAPVQGLDPLKPQLAAAKKKKIPVVAINAGPNSSGISGNIQQGNAEAGAGATKMLAEQLGGKGGIVIIQGPLARSTPANRQKGIDKALKQYPGIEVLAKDSTDGSRSEATDAMRNWISIYGDDIKGVVAHNDDLAIGALTALKEAGKSVPIVGIDGNEDGLKAVESGDFIGTMMQNAAVQGAAALGIATALANGSGPNGAKGIHTDPVYLMTPITKDNVAVALQHVVTDRQAFIEQLPALTDKNLKTGNISDEGIPPATG